jgi:transposase
MPHINYPVAITESEAELGILERQLRGRATQPRVQMLRVLKSGQARSLLAVAPLVGYSVRQVNRWWTTYQKDGLAALLTERVRPGMPSRLTDAARADLEAAMARGEIATLKDAQRYLRTHWQIEYRSLNGIWHQFRKHTIRRKTGRRRHRQADPVAQNAYKRGLRRPAHAPPVHRRLGAG